MRTMGRFAVWLATGLGIGLVVPAPGTIGGLWGLPVVWAIAALPGQALQLFTIGLLGWVGVSLCGRAAHAMGHLKDPGAIVLDEILALPIVFIDVEIRHPAVWVVGFLLFRLLDISKPWPIGWAERLPEGWGIMADDWLAAAFACLALHGLLWVDQALELSLLHT